MKLAWGDLSDLATNHWGDGSVLRVIEPFWAVVTLSPWPEDGHPELVWWCGDHWSFERWENVLCYSYREAVQVAADLGAMPWSNGPCLALNLADEQRDEDAFMASLYSDYRHKSGGVKHAHSKTTLTNLLDRGRHTRVMS